MDIQKPYSDEICRPRKRQDSAAGPATDSTFAPATLASVLERDASLRGLLEGAIRRHLAAEKEIPPR
jgi:hypothetical protein